MNTAAKFALLVGSLTFAGATLALAQEHPSEEDHMHQHPPRLGQVVALDECDPATFNAALGPDFCRNVTLGAFTVLTDLFAKAAAGTPDRGWDFEPDTLKVKEGTDVSVVDQGNAPGEDTVPECNGGFKNVAVAKTRILQASHLEVTGLAKGEHHFQCCIHPWMRMTVEVK
jgi:plastocyanin